MTLFGRCAFGAPLQALLFRALLGSSVLLAFSCRGTAPVLVRPPEAPVEITTEAQAAESAAEAPVEIPAAAALEPAADIPASAALEPAADTLAAEPAAEELPSLVLVEEIMGQGFLSANDLASFLLVTNGDLEDERVRALAEAYLYEAAFEGVNHDIAFAQMCLETGFLRFGNLVSADQNNFCGLGSIGPGQPGEHFETMELGVRAHIQHLKAYATAEPLSGELVDPRYKWVRLGSSPGFRGLAGTWAADPFYGDKLAEMLMRMYRLTGLSAQDVPARGNFH